MPTVRMPSGFLPVTTLGFVNTTIAVPVAWLGFVLFHMAAVSMVMAAVRRWGRITPFRMRVVLGFTGATTMAMPVRAEHTEQHEVDEEAEQCHDGHQLAVHLHGVNHPLGGTGGHRRGGIRMAVNSVRYDRHTREYAYTHTSGTHTGARPT